MKLSTEFSLEEGHSLVTAEAATDLKIPRAVPFPGIARFSDFSLNRSNNDSNTFGTGGEGGNWV